MIALLMSLMVQAAQPAAVPAQAQVLTSAQNPAQAEPAAASTPNAPRNRPRREVADQCQFRARTGSIRRQNICSTSRQADAQRAVASRYLEEVQVPQAAPDIPGGGPR